MKNAQGRGNILLVRPLCAGDGKKLWTIPKSGIKVNMDAALFVEKLRFGFGYMIRNVSGQLVEGMMRCKEGIVAPEVAEVLGIKEVLSWLKTQHDGP